MVTYRLNSSYFSSKMYGFRKQAFYASVLCTAFAIVVYILGQYFGGDIIKSAYNKESIALINSLITGQDTHSLIEYLREYAKLVSTITELFLIISFYALLLAVAPKTDNSIDAYFMIILSLSVSSILWIIGEPRHYLNYLTETDFISTYLPEALRFINKEPLLLTWQPPGYPIAVSLFYIWLNDWLHAGLMLTIISSVLTMIASFYLFRPIIGRTAAWISVATTLSSGLFILFSCMATTDIFFLALFYASLLACLFSISREKTYWWFIAGAISGLAILVRVNAITLALVLIAPLYKRISQKHLAISLSFVFAGFFTILLFWISFANYTHSNIWPSEGTTLNLASTYFSPRNLNPTVAVYELKGKFQSPLDVIAQDPVRIFRQYVHALLLLAKKAFLTNEIVTTPANFLALLGLFLIFNKPKQYKELLLVIIFVVLQLMLVNIKTYESRYYLFLTPLIGAIAGVAIQAMQSKQISPIIANVFRVVILATFITSFYFSAEGAISKLRREEREVAAVVEVINQSKITNQTIFSVKPHVAYYTSNNHMPIELISVGDLRNAMASKAPFHDVFLLFGSDERGGSIENGFSLLGNKASAPDWLTVVKDGKEGGGWILYRFNGGRLPLK